MFWLDNTLGSREWPRASQDARVMSVASPFLSSSCWRPQPTGCRAALLQSDCAEAGN